MQFFPVTVLLTLTSSSFAGKADSRQAQVNRAIELTKSRQMNTPVGRTATKPVPNNSVRNEVIDVYRLNLLIRALDKSWVLPQLGSKDPVGSNFQYKKTCASIFKARHGACQQLSFGVMCFNYCHEQGEKLSYRCQDASDAAYCRQAGTFETFLAKFRKDSYKAKTYVHQMISRCFATAICNTQTGILNSTIIDDEENVVVTKKINPMRLLTRGPKTSVSRTTIPMEEADYGEDEEDIEEPTTTTRRRRLTERKRTTRPKTTTTVASVTETSSKSNIWSRFTISRATKRPFKTISIWRRLLTTTKKPSSKSVETTTEASSLIATNPYTEEEIVDEELPVETTTPDDQFTITTDHPYQKTNRVTDEIEQQTTTMNTHTFEPLPMTIPPDVGPEIASQKPAEKDRGFWNRFQPNRWFQSIQYLTNTGK